jgi:hypothetical protein
MINQSSSSLDFMGFHGALSHSCSNSIELGLSIGIKGIRNHIEQTVGV